jgi:hypothetical protein
MQIFGAPNCILLSSYICHVYSLCKAGIRREIRPHKFFPEFIDGDFEISVALENYQHVK